VTSPRVIVEGPTSQARMRWRVVLSEKEDNHGVLREVRTIELADETDRDAMGVQRWRSLNMKSAQSDWMLVCEAALNLALEQETTCPQ
jgi:hypothetical protein